MLALNNVTYTQGTMNILSHASLQIHPGELVCIVGPSASGKSTLIALLTKTLSPTEGTIEVDGVDLNLLPPTILHLYRNRLGVLLQEDSLSPHRTVVENMSLPLELRHTSPSSIAQHVTCLLHKIHLSSHAFDLPHALSYGERKLILIARSLIHHPLILLADEPLSGLDTEQAITTIKLLQEHHSQGNTVIIMTTDARLPEELNARIIELHKGSLKEASPLHSAPKEILAHEIFEEAPQGKRVKITASPS